MNRVFRAYAESVKFSFEAHAADPETARAALVGALEVHGRAYRLAEGWWEGRIEIGEAEFAIGSGYRDGRPVGRGLGGEACAPPLRKDWWRRYDLATDEYLLGAGYRDRSPVRAAEAEPESPLPPGP